MKQILTFPKGGIHPHGKKYLSSSLFIKNAHIPSHVIVPLHQHIGKPAECVVNKGDHVTEGMLIGKATGFVSANIHSPIPGVVKKVSGIYLPGGLKSMAVEIELEGEFSRSGKELKTYNADLDKKELLNIISEMGIVGLGGATFPTHVKYSVKEGNNIQHLIINGVECEPYLTADHRLMLEKADQILAGIAIVKNIVSASSVYIAIENNKRDAIELLKEKVEQKSLPYEVVPLKVKYPQGDEKMLLKALLNKEVPSGGLPLDIGAVVSNVGTIYAIYEAVYQRKPLIERVVSVTGEALASPQNLKVRIGTKVGELIEECGGFKEPLGKLIAGGPMMGLALANLDTPVTKGMSGLIAFSRKQTRIFNEQPCISCGACIQACPWNLMPTLQYKLIMHNEYEEAQSQGLWDCKECGCCAYVCPSHIPLVHAFKLGKVMVRKIKE